MAGIRNAPSTPTSERRSIFPSSYTSSKKKLRSGSYGQDADHGAVHPPLSSSSQSTSTSTPDIRMPPKVNFSPYARCVKVESHHAMTELEKKDIWWTKNDYSGFARVSRIITKAMLEGGSEIWLQSSPSLTTSSSSSKPSSTKSSSASFTNPKRSSSGATASDDNNVTTHNKSPTNNATDKAKQFHATRDKWWHRFGHSRRGLEHLASIGEGKQRHANVRSSIQVVIQEQQRLRRMKRHRLTDSESTTSSTISASTVDMTKTFREESDDERIRAVYIRHTRWARSLSRAAGQSDADAVQTNFDESKRKPREFYLKMQMGGGTAADHPTMYTEHKGAATTIHTLSSSDNDDIHGLSSLMKKVLTIEALKLDANTASQLSFKYENLMKERQQQQQHRRRGPTGSMSSSSTFLSASHQIVTQRSNHSSPTNQAMDIDTDTVVSSSSSSSPSPPATFASPHVEKNVDDETDPIHSQLSSTSSSSLSPSTSTATPLAKKAQGFSGDEADSKIDMSAVLTGQGFIIG